MPHSGEDLAADLIDLWEAGEVVLRPLGAEFRSAADTLTWDSGMNAFNRDPVFGGSSGPVKMLWTGVRDDLFEVLRTTAENLELTGEAMAMAADEYAQGDNEARRLFDEMQPVVLTEAIRVARENGWQPPPVAYESGAVE